VEVEAEAELKEEYAFGEVLLRATSCGNFVNILRASTGTAKCTGELAVSLLGACKTLAVSLQLACRARRLGQKCTFHSCNFPLFHLSTWPLSIFLPRDFFLPKLNRSSSKLAPTVGGQTVAQKSSKKPEPSSWRQF